MIKLKDFSSQSENSFTKIVPGELAENLKWWYFFIPGSLARYGTKNSSHLYAGTNVCPSCVPTSCAMLTVAEASATAVMLSIEDTFVRR